MKSTNNHEYIHFSLKIENKDKKKLVLAEDIIKIDQSQKSTFKDTQ